MQNLLITSLNFQNFGIIVLNHYDNIKIHTIKSTILSIKISSTSALFISFVTNIMYIYI